jgi:hypothetical protein
LWFVDGGAAVGGAVVELGADVGFEAVELAHQGGLAGSSVAWGLPVGSPESAGYVD